MEHPTIGDRWEEGYAVIEIHIFDKIYMFSSDHLRECRGTVPNCEGQLHSLK